MTELSYYLQADFQKYGLEYKGKDFIKHVFGKSVALKFICLFRLTRSCKSQTRRKIVRQVLMGIERQYGLEIPDTIEIGKGLYIGHPYGITINPETKMGNNIAFIRVLLLEEKIEGNEWGHLLLVMMCGLESILLLLGV